MRNLFILPPSFGHHSFESKIFFSRVSPSLVFIDEKTKHNVMKCW